MAKHHPDLIMCQKQPGIAIGRLCEKCDDKCVICDSYVRPCTLVRPRDLLPHHPGSPKQNLDNIRSGRNDRIAYRQGTKY
ncbi:hypothetical protein DVH24_036155 [Malus domestica]|uniref:Uncharacterized protein n=1 Tax=Malus domestica TaxID=3750 RepID=A0A498II23_MALDO|nr:hypothetical protein DVH24_036155 [Malus domestica]